MKRMETKVGVVVACLGLLAVGVARAEAPAPKSAAAGGAQLENCAEMFKALIPLPTKFGELMTAVAAGLEGHAAWVATSKDKASQAEAAAMRKVAADHAQVATQMKKIVADMEKGAKLAPAPHDMTKSDPKALDGMLKNAALEREMAALMVKHAEDTEKMVKDMQKGAPAAK